MLVTLVCVDSLEELRIDLWARWRDAFNRFEEISGASQSGVRTVYANNSLFDLRNYIPHKFTPGGRVLKELPKGVNSYHVYRLDGGGRPVHMTARHVFNNIDWQGVYLYSDTEAEYVEFCIQTKVINEYTRMTIRDGLPATMQHIKINGGGSHLAGHTGKNAIDFIASSPFNYFAEVEQYEVSTGRITSGRALAGGLGTSDLRSTLAYSYSDSGKLQQVVRTHDTGRKTLDYTAQTAATTDDLATRLSEKIAAQVIEALKKIDFGSPLLTVELSYRQVTNYVPHIVAVTERDFHANPTPAALIDHKYWIDLIDEEFEPEMTELTERLNVAEEWDPGTSLLRKAALLLTQRVPRLLPTADSFVAFPIDWEFEGQDLEAILLECGATTETLQKLKRIGWLD